MKCKKNRHLRYVTIKAGLNEREIYIFKHKKTKEDALEPNNIHDFWYGFITPDEIVIVLGSETNRRTINYAHCIMYCEQIKAEKLDPAVMFVIGSAEKRVASYPFDEFEKLLRRC